MKAPVPLVSIVLPTFNGMGTLPAVFSAIRRQLADFSFELVVIDSSSTDGTQELARSAADRCEVISQEHFDHGLTRNRAISLCRGELIVMLSQDAEPLSDGWLAALTAPLRRDPSVAGTFARQQLRASPCPMLRFYHARDLTSSLESRVVGINGLDEYTALPPIERLQRCRFDNVCSCLRRTVWEEAPFPSTPIAEDLWWSKRALLAGHKIAYVADAVVLHSHERSARYELIRTYFVHQQLYLLFGIRTIPTLRALVVATASSVRLHLRCVFAIDARRQSGDVTRAITLAVAWPLGQFAGALAAARQMNLVRRRRIRCVS